ncbi:hypothetical protein [Phenylobacterium sp.]|uniref:hypothetical protein n=1 Tax=Phenylobacterium sp. TaxID=1871053 RepID=UPI0035B0BD01
MLVQALESVFANAATPQKIVLVVLLAAVPATLAAAVLALRSEAQDNIWRRIVADLRIAGPALGLLVGGLNSFHMGRTIQRLPFDPTLKQLAPGIFEVSTLVSLGALAGLVAVAAHAALGLAALRARAA